MQRRRRRWQQHGAKMSVEVLCSGAGTGRLSTGGRRGRRREIQTPSRRPHLETNGTAGLLLYRLSQDSLCEGDTLDSRGRSIIFLLVAAKNLLFFERIQGNTKSKGCLSIYMFCVLVVSMYVCVFVGQSHFSCINKYADV